jgi:uncharacterized protein (TIGR03086 family)
MRALPGCYGTLCSVPTSAPLNGLERADQQLRRLISHVRGEDAGLPTPCTEFDLRTLINHLVYDVQTFKTLLTGGERGSPDVDLIGNEWLAAYEAAADALLAAWRARGTDGTLTTRLGEFPATWGVGQHMGALVVHAWDIAVSTGQVAELDPELASVALEWGRENLKPQFRGTAFAPEVAVASDAPVYDRLAGFFGRTPR